MNSAPGSFYIPSVAIKWTLLPTFDHYLKAHMYKSIQKWRNAWSDSYKVIYYQWRAINGLQVTTGIPGSYKIRWVGIKVVRDLSCSRTHEDWISSLLPSLLNSDSPSSHLSSLVYNTLTNGCSHLLTVIPNDEWKDWLGKRLSGSQSFLLCILQCSWTFAGYYTLQSIEEAYDYLLRSWLKHEILLYYLVHSNGVNTFLLHLLHCLSQKQEYSFTFLTHACKWKLSLLWNCLQACLDQWFVSLDSTASMQSALCPQNLTPSVSIKKWRVESSIIKLMGNLCHNCICLHTCVCTSKSAKELLKPLTLTSHSANLCDLCHDGILD